MCLQKSVRYNHVSFTKSLYCREKGSRTDDTQDQHFFVGTISIQKDIFMINTEWNTFILNGKQVNFKLDTGAQENILFKKIAVKLKARKLQWF